MSATTGGNDRRYALPIISSSCVSELDLVRGVLKVMQGLSSSLFYWDHISQSFCILKGGLYVSHLSRSSLHNLLHRFLFPATCLRLVRGVVSKVELEICVPTLRAFAHGVSQWLTKMQDIALMEETNMCKSDATVTPTLLALTSSLSSLCSSAEYLLHIVHGAIPAYFFHSSSPISSAEMAVHVVDYLFRKLDEVCLIQGGEGQPYQMVLHLLVGSLLPLIEALDSWICNGILDDPFEEMFFYSNKQVSMGDSEFWVKSYLVRQAQHQKLGAKDSTQTCPFFLKDIAKSVMSAGKSLRLLHQVPNSLTKSAKIWSHINFGSCMCSKDNDFSDSQRETSGLTLSEIFCLSVAGLVGNHDHVFQYLLLDANLMPNGKLSTETTCFEKVWHQFFVDTLQQKNTRLAHLCRFYAGNLDFSDKDEEHIHTNAVAAAVDDDGYTNLQRSCSLENPVITVCENSLDKCMNSWRTLSSSRCQLPPLNDRVLHEAVFGRERDGVSVIRGTNYASGLPVGEFEHSRLDDGVKLLEAFFPFPTILPPYQEEVFVSKLLPHQNNSALASKVLEWMLSVEPRNTPLPGVILQECLFIYIVKQVGCIGKLILSKLMNDWGLMDELAVLRAIYLLGSGDLLQHFLVVAIGKLDKREIWDDDFELNMILQESIRNSADGMLLGAPESLVVSITHASSIGGAVLHRKPNSASTAPRIYSSHNGVDYLQLLTFTYNVPWPLGLIVNAEATKKYNQVMRFLLKVKRAKFLLDQARKWMWKDRSAMLKNRRYSWMLEQKLLHFVDAFHQYVMDRVYHNEWRELCLGMKAAASLDEVIEAHDAYLLSIQRQCFLVPDKLWALIASRINTILGLALDFYATQQLCGGGGGGGGSVGCVSGVTLASRVRFQAEFDRIEKQFDECVGFLLRVLSFKLNVGNFPHLSDLITRINYNYFFLPDYESSAITTNSAATAMD